MIEDVLEQVNTYTYFRKEKINLKTHYRMISFQTRMRYRGGKYTSYPVFVVSLSNGETFAVSIFKHGWDQSWKKALLTCRKKEKSALIKRKDWRSPDIRRYII